MDFEQLCHATNRKTHADVLYLLDRNCSETPEMCHEESTCSLVPPEVCVAERPNNYRCVCNEGYTGDGSDCQGKQTAVSPDMPFK